MNIPRFTLLIPLLGLVSILGAASSYADRAHLDPTKTQIALPLEEAPVIDGVINAEEWQRSGGAAGNFWAVTVDTNAGDGIRGGNLGDTGTPPANNDDLSYTVYAGFDAQNLYVAVRVRDDNLQEDSAEAGSANGNTWMDDSVEIFVDGDNSNYPNRDTSGSNAEVVGSGGQYVITVNNAYREAEAGNPGYGQNGKWHALTTKTATGYDAEFRIALSSIGNPKAGDIIGFTVGVNDDDDGAGGERQLMWVGRPHTEASYGNLMLGGRSYTAGKKSGVKVDGVILPGEYAGAEVIRVGSESGIFDGPSGDDTWAFGDLNYRAWVVHDTEAVYVAVDVVDDMVVTDTAEAGTENGNTWEDDSVEIFFDADEGNELGRGAAGFEGQLVLTANGAWRHAEANNPMFGENGDWHGVVTKTFFGYQAEFKVKKSGLLNPADGKSVGFHVAVNDDDGAGRKSQMGWSGRAHSEFTYGSLTLGGAGGGGGEPPRLTVQRVGGGLTLSWPAAAAGYILESKARLSDASWSAVAGVANNSVTVQPTGESRFYRLRQ